MTSNYQMWLTSNGESEKFQFPVLPENFQTDRGSKNQSVTISELGEITIIQSRPAVNFSFSSFFPKTSFYGVDSIDSPLALVEKIIELKQSNKPVRFVITGCDVDIFCTIEDFKISENGGDVGTIHYSISLKEYRAITVRQVSVEIKTQTASVKPNNTRIDNTVKPKTHTVKKGDCLWNIAHKYLGNGSRYTEIKTLNGLKSDLIHPNQVLKIP